MLSLALGIGANTAVFSLLETIVLRELPVREPGALVQIVGTDGKAAQGAFSYPSYEWLRANAPMFSHVFTWRLNNVWAGQGDSMEWISVDKVSEDYFTGLGASAILGRTLGDESSQPGASRGNVLWLVMKQSVALVLIGMAIGCAAAMALARYVQSLLFGMKPADPVTIVIASAGLVIVTALAVWIPARRAAAVDPVQALRYE